ncbi:MAG TPA: TonB-dependent receptor, partial [Terriglobales bacterium]|nr:TonB-dependent receptor [Terriglobales bacterium]
MESHFRPKFGTMLGALLLVLVFSIAALAQGTGELTGVVNDPTGAVVPNVEVKLTNNSTGIVRTTVTSAAGVYRFPALPVVGTYTLNIDAKGFKGVAVREIVVSVGTTVSKDVRLEVGTTSEVVNVEGGVQMVQTTESQVSALVDQRVWQQMPLETRNQNEFINLIAGVTPDMFGGSTRGSSVNGTRGGSGNFLVEGADNNDQGQGGRGQISDSQGGAITGISPEAIQEYRVITNSFAAEYGKAGGFVTDTVLKSGTNQFHGSLFEYNRNQALAANSFFSNRETDPQTGETLKDFVVRNQFGGSFGGPIVKDKTFFYSSLEFHRRRDRYPTRTTSIAPQFLDWVQSGGFQNWLENDFCVAYLDETCPGAFPNSGQLGAVFQRLRAKGPFPLATSNFSNDAQGWMTYGLTYPVPVYGDAVVRDGYQLNQYKWSFKFDHKISDTDQFSASYLLDDGEQTWLYGGADYTIGPPSVSPGRSQNLALSWNHTFSPTILNTFKASYLRHVANYPSYPGYESMPQVYTAADPLGVGFGMSSAMPQFFTDNQFQFQDHLSFVKGKHSFKTGVEYRRTRNGSSFEANKSGEFLPWDVENMVTDMAFGEEADAAIYGEPAYGGWYWAKASINPQTGTRPEYYRGFRANEFAAYFQDDVRVSNRLTVNYGVRWEYFGPPHNYKPGIDSNFYFGVPIMPASAVSTNIFFPKNSAFYASVATGGFQQRDHEIWNKDTNNFSPRFGFAYDVFGNQKFVLRGGAGIMYDRIWNNLFENIRFNAPFYSDATIGWGGNGLPTSPLSAPGLYTDNFTATNTAGFNNPTYLAKPAPRHMDQNLVSPYYQQYHFGFQYEFMKGYVLETEYVGTMGHKLTAMIDINTFNGRTAAGQSTRRI